MSILFVGKQGTWRFSQGLEWTWDGKAVEGWGKGLITGQARPCRKVWVMPHLLGGMDKRMRGARWRYGRRIREEIRDWDGDGGYHSMRICYCEKVGVQGIGIARSSDGCEMAHQETDSETVGLVTTDAMQE